MDDLIGFMLGLGVFVALLMLFIYVLGFLLLAAMFLVPCYFLGRQFLRQVVEKYRLTWLSALALFLVGFVSAFGALELTDLMREPQWFSYLLMVPLFLLLATSTLGLWGLFKIYPLLQKSMRAEQMQSRNRGQIKEKRHHIELLAKEKQRIEAKHAEVWKKRANLQARVRELCTRVGDQRFRTVWKEKLEKAVTELPQKELKGQLAGLEKEAAPGERKELERCVLEIAMIDQRTFKAQNRLRSKKQSIATNREKKERLEQESLEVGRESRAAREALKQYREQKIVLN